MAEPKPIYVCSGYSVVILSAPGLYAECTERFGKPKPPKGK